MINLWNKKLYCAIKSHRKLTSNIFEYIGICVQVRKERQALARLDKDKLADIGVSKNQRDSEAKSSPFISRSLYMARTTRNKFWQM